MPSSEDLRLIDELAAGFESRFRDRITSGRTVGREAEYPLVGPDGRSRDAAAVWKQLLAEGGCTPIRDERAPDGQGALVGIKSDRWSAVSEVGRGTVEVVIGPRASLQELAADLDLALARVIPAARRTGALLLGYGIQPRTPPHPRLLTPKRRYAALLRAIGPRWLRFAVTASDQVHVDITRTELIPAFNLFNAVSGAFIALSANSSVYGGRVGRYASGREGLMVATTPEPYRHGAVPRPFVDVGDYTRWAAAFRCLCLPGASGTYIFPRGAYIDHARGRPANLEEFLFHEHYLWPSARPRARLGTLEIRPACQQPIADSWAPAALAVGLTEMLPEAAAALDDAIGNAAWPSLLQFRSRAVRWGLGAKEPAAGFLEAVLDVAERGLKARGYGEEVLVEAFRERLALREGPSDRAREAVRSDGIVALIDAAALY
jgi:gamma-glutamylcysteine synthetase